MTVCVHLQVHVQVILCNHKQASVMQYVIFATVQDKRRQVIFLQAFFSKTGVKLIKYM